MQYQYYYSAQDKSLEIHELLNNFDLSSNLIFELKRTIECFCQRVYCMEHWDNVLKIKEND